MSNKVNSIAADDLVTQGVRTSAAMVLYLTRYFSLSTFFLTFNMYASTIKIQLTYTPAGDDGANLRRTRVYIGIAIQVQNDIHTDD